MLQGHDCDLVHISGKQNPADFLSRRSIQDVKKMVKVRAEEEALIRRLQLGEDKSDDAIQRHLDKVFGKSRPGVAKVNGQEEESNSRKAILVARSRVTLMRELKEKIKEGLKSEEYWAENLE